MIPRKGRAVSSWQRTTIPVPWEKRLRELLRIGILFAEGNQEDDTMSPSSGGFFWNWVRTSLKILHRLWLEVTGFIFCAFAVFGGFSLLREWRLHQDGGELWKVVAAGVFTVVMALFGVYSFAKSHRVQ